MRKKKATKADAKIEEIRRNVEIRRLNDLVRDSLCRFGNGKLVITPGVQALSEDDRQKLYDKVVEFKEFTKANDPHKEHDFGKIDFQGTEYFWKIDYYDPTLSYHSEDNTDQKKTVRVLTIMRADEY